MFLDLLAEDDRLNVYAGKLEVRPPGAPTTQDRLGGGGRAARHTRRAVSDGPVRQSARSGRSEMIWLDSEPPQLRLEGLPRHPEYCSGPVGARDSSRRL